MSSVPPNPPNPPIVPPSPQASLQLPYPQAAYPQPAPGFAQPYAYPVAPPTNVLAIITLVLSLVGVAIGAVVTGHISLGQIRKTGEQGRGMALAGLIIGYVGCAFWVVLIVVMVVLPFVMVALLGGISSVSGYLNS